MMKPARFRLAAVFLYTAAGILLLTGAAKLYSATGSVRILTATDQVLHLTYRNVMICAGVLEAAIAGYIFFGGKAVVKLWLVMWLSANFLMYRCVNDLLHIKVCPCLGTIESMLPIGRAQVDFLLTMAVLYLFFGSATALLPSSLTDWRAHLRSPSPSQGHVQNRKKSEAD